MNKERLMNILLAPHVSEKASVAADKGEFVFKVALDANKREIKQSVELMFGVNVESVKTLVVKGKTKRTGGTFGRRSNWKKAYVTLQEGQDIDFANIE